MAREKTERPGDAASNTAPRSALSVAELRQLITLMNGSEIEEIGIEEAASGLRLSLRKPASITAAVMPVDDDALDYAIADGPMTDPATTIMEITSPLVGLFRASMKPGGRPLCALGDIVREGQVVCAVESLNVPNEVEAPAAGRITAIFVIDGQPVEYGQPLIAIEPQG